MGSSKTTKQKQYKKFDEIAKKETVKKTLETLKAELKLKKVLEEDPDAIKKLLKKMKEEKG